MLSFSGVTFVLFCFVFVFFLSLKPRPLVQSLFVLRYACTPTATRSYLTTLCVLFRLCFFLLFVSLEISLFPSMFVPLPFSLCMESTYVFSFRMAFFYLVTTGWSFYTSLHESAINPSINHILGNFELLYLHFFVYLLVVLMDCTEYSGTVRTSPCT